MEEEVENENQIKIVEKRVLKNETSVNSKDSINWMIYSFFLRHVSLYNKVRSFNNAMNLLINIQETANSRVTLLHILDRL
jgi:hypothetical protein